MPDNVLTNRLVELGAHGVTDAIRDNPGGPVRMVTDLTRTETAYDVVVGDRVVWHRRVLAGRSFHDRAAHAGATHVQLVVATTILALMEESR